MQSAALRSSGAVTHWKTPPPAVAATAAASTTTGDTPESLLSNLAFLQRMADVFAEQGNYAECVRSAESALLLRQANAATVAAALTVRQQQSQKKKTAITTAALTSSQPAPVAAAPPSTKTSMQNHDSNSNSINSSAPQGSVALTDKGDVSLPLEISQQAHDVVQRCNSYAVDALRHDQFDSAAFFLNRAMFLTDGDDDDDGSDLRGALLGDEGYAAMTFPGSSDRWWWRRVLQPQQQQSAPTQISSSSFTEKSGEAGDALDLSNGHDHGDGETRGSATRSAAAALRACFRDTPHDQQLRLALRAATLNHLGCLEQRRGRLGPAVIFFRTSIRTATQLPEAAADRAAGIVSTYLNLCTVLNAMGRHAEAVQACERVVPLLQQALQETVHTSSIPAALRGTATGVLHTDDAAADVSSATQASDETHVATMLVVAYYNLGVSLERRDASRRSSDGGPQRAFQQAVQVSHAYHLVPASCRSVEAVMQALRHPPPSSSDGDSGTMKEASREVPTEQQQPQGAEMKAAVTTTATTRTPCPSSQTRSTHLPTHVLPRIASATPTGSAETANSLRRVPQPPSSIRPPSPPPLPVASLTAPSNDATTPFSPHRRPSGTDPRVSRSTRPGSGNSATCPTPSATQQQQQQQQPPSTFTASSAWTSPFSAAPPAVLAPLPAGVATVRVGPPPPPPPLPPSVIFAATAPPAFTRPTPPPSRLTSSGGRGGSGGGIPKTTSTLTASQSSFRTTRSSVNPFGRRTFGNTLPLPARDRGSASAAEASGRASSARGTTGGVDRSLRSGGIGAKSARGTVRDRLADANAAAPAAASGGATDGMGRTTQQQQQRSKRQKSIDRRQQRETAAVDAVLAEKVYQQLVSEKEKAEVERCRRAAVQIQRVWRGVLARTWVATLIHAAVCLQRAVRRFLVKARAEHARVAAEQARQRAAEAARQEAACRILQGRVRQFLRRLQIRREYRASQTRLFYAARTIQRGYRAFCAQRAAQLAAQAGAHRREDAQHRFRERVAARRIQHAYLTYKTKRAELDAYQVRQRRIRSVVRIQAVVRGYLTRAWYAYYRVYRREQEVRSAAMQARLVVVQAACRAICSAFYGQQRALQALLHMREVQQHTAATRIQCLWRRHVAVIRRERLQAEHDRHVRHATRIQRWYRMRTQRRAFMAWRVEQQRMRAAARLQRWIRACWQAAKAREFAAYHTELLRQQQLQRLQAHAITVMQACANACVSGRLVASVRVTFDRNDAVARRWQRVGRGFVGRREMALEQRAAYAVAQKEKETATRRAAASVLQRAWRCAAAKDTVAARRRAVAAANVIARAYRVYRARAQLATLRAVRQQEREDTAARHIQQAARGFLYGRRAREMDAYYRAEHHKKMRRLRRVEAAVMIQAQWRGYVTRRAVREEQEAWQALSASAAVIQRAWRMRQARQQLRTTLAARIVQRTQDARAALTLQCFWRKTLAGRLVARLRLETRRRVAAAAVLQSWWRTHLARREFARMRRLRQEEAALQVYYAIQWEKHATLINAFLRQRAAQIAAVEDHRQRLIHLLTEEDRRRFLSRHEAATKIQSLFRGHYERYYVRGLRAQAREEQRRREELLARQQQAATTIQCAYRSATARAALAALRQAELDRVQESYADYLESADPSEVVRELFWLNSTYQQREAALRRKQEAERRRDAAARIQQLYRRHRAHRVVAAALDAHQQERAARLLQDYWRHHREVHRIKEHQRRQAAATLLQSHIRGWIVRRGWPLYRAAIEAERQEQVLVQDVLDHAAIVLQCFWRRVEAQRTAARLRLLRRAEHDARAQQEAAMVIQEAFRSHQHRKKMGLQ